MKELTIEEKAKCFDEAIKKVNDYYEGKTKLYSDVDETLEYLFPKLKESEKDEKIRKALIRFHKSTIDIDGIKGDDIVAWLEKQGDSNKEYWRGYREGKKEIIDKYSELKKPTKWSKEDIDIIDGIIMDYKGEIEHLSNSAIDEQAKPIYQERIDFLNRLKTCCPELYNNVQKKIDDAIYLIEHYATHGHDRNLRNKVIDELEYVKHELEKQGEQNPTEWSKEDELHIRELESLVKQVWATAERENDKDTIHKMSDLSFFLKTLKPQLKQEWSEDDENILRRVFDSLNTYAKGSYPILKSVVEEEIDWLKSLKDRVLPKIELSEDYEQRIKNILLVLDAQVCWDGATGKKKNPYQKEIDWLKSIRYQKQWKPNDKQINALSDVLSLRDIKTDILSELLKRLKKLK